MSARRFEFLRVPGYRAPLGRLRLCVSPRDCDRCGNVISYREPYWYVNSFFPKAICEKCAGGGVA